MAPDPNASDEGPKRLVSREMQAPAPFALVEDLLVLDLDASVVAVDHQVPIVVVRHLEDDRAEIEKPPWYSYSSPSRYAWYSSAPMRHARADEPRSCTESWVPPAQPPRSNHRCSIGDL